ncbi:MAG: tetratricopeptide repeat protein [Sneathiellaceae bacterium]
MPAHRPPAESADPGRILASARQALASGRPAEAAGLLEPLAAPAALATLPRPMRAAIHAFRGAAALQLGDPALAAQAFRDAMRIDRKDAGLACNLGAALQMAGEPGQALEAFQEAARRAPGSAQAAYGRGVALHGLERFDAAAEALKLATRLDPAMLPAWENRALTLAAAGQTAAADAVWRDALAAFPADSQGRRRLAAGLARHLAGTGRPADALPQFAIARAGTAAADPALQYDEARALLQAGHAGDAADRLTGLTTAHGADNAEWLSTLGAAHIAAGRPEQALPVLRSAAAAAPGHRSTNLHLAFALQSLGDLPEAADRLRALLADDPAYLPALVGLANILAETGDDAGAAAAFAQAEALAPEQPQLRWNRALHDLLCGRYDRGWDGYGTRWQVADFPTAWLDTGLPAWDGTAPEGRHLFVWPEQGPGDEIMFASCLPDLLSRGAKVSLSASPRLAPLLARSFPAADVAATAIPPPGADAALPIGDLPRHFRRSEAAFPRRGRFLSADPDQVRHWRERWRAAAGPGIRIVGLSWRGGVTPGERRRRGATLEDWSPALRLPGLAWVNMQYGADAAARFAATADIYGFPVLDGPDPAGDLDALAAAVAATDGIASMANTLVHLAGGLGQPTLVVVPAAPSWRWQRARTDSPWYPAARLLRQDRDEGWPQVMSRVAAALPDLLAETAPADLQPGSGGPRTMTDQP